MADKEDEASEEAFKSGDLKKRIIIIAAVVVLLLGGAVGGLVLYMQSTAVPEVASTQDGEEDSEEVYSSDRGKAIYHRLRPKFITTFVANSNQRYVQMEVTLLTRDEDVISALVAHNPMIRNALVRVIGEQNYLELQTLAGKEKLRKAVLRAVQRVLENETGAGGVEKVLFTNFVMQ